MRPDAFGWVCIIVAVTLWIASYSAGGQDTLRGVSLHSAATWMLACAALNQRCDHDR